MQNTIILPSHGLGEPFNEENKITFSLVGREKDINWNGIGTEDEQRKQKHVNGQHLI